MKFFIIGWNIVVFASKESYIAKKAILKKVRFLICLAFSSVIDKRSILDSPRIFEFAKSRFLFVEKIESFVIHSPGVLKPSSS